MRKEQLTNGQSDLLLNLATVIVEGDYSWYYIPYWFKGLRNGTFEIYKFEQLPDELINAIKDMTGEPKDDKPPQYKIGIDTFDRIRSNATYDEAVGFCKYNIDKYIHRKKGSDREDLIKVVDYVNLWIELMDKHNKL